MFSLYDNLPNEELKILLEAYDSLPNSFRNVVAADMPDIIKNVYKTKIYICESSTIASMLPSGYYTSVEDPEYSVLQKDVLLINKDLNRSKEPAVSNDIRRLLHIECYDKNSYKKFDEECNKVSNIIMESSMGDNEKSYLINLVNTRITKLKITDMQNILKVYNENVIDHYDPNGKLIMIYENINDMITNQSKVNELSMYPLLSLYAEETGNEPIRFLNQINLKHGTSFMLESTSLDESYPAVKIANKINTLGKLKNESDREIVCMESDGNLILGQNIFTHYRDIEDNELFINTIDENYIAGIVGCNVKFDLNEQDRMYMFDESNGLPTTMLYMDIGEFRYLCEYNDQVYLLFKELGKTKIFGININKNNIIEINTNNIKYEFSYEN